MTEATRQIDPQTINVETDDEEERTPQRSLQRSVRRLAVRMYKWMPRVSRLSFMMISLNMLVILGVVSAILFLDNRRERLIDVRIGALVREAEIFAGALAQGAALGPASTALDPDEAVKILRRLVIPTGVRARLYSPKGRLISDTKLLVTQGDVIIAELPPPGQEKSIWLGGERFYEFMTRIYYGVRLPDYREFAGQPGTDYPEVRRALEGYVDSARRQNSQGELVFTVAYPVQEFKVVLGALLISSEGGDIDAIVREDRFKTFFVLLIGLIGSLSSSVFLFLRIARPIRVLAMAADLATTGTNIARIEIPDLSRRKDEIGDLSTSLREMMRSLYDRIEAIESFAADVSHEIKNPLTSIRSAVETLEFVKSEEDRKRLQQLINDDVGRLDRLITDISNASRLDAELAREASDPVDMRLLFESLGDLYRATDKEDEASVLFHIEGVDRPGRKDKYKVRGIEGRLGQVMRNLIGNAVSFNPPDGEVRVRMKRKFIRGAPHIIVAVSDEGPGIPEENLETIFNRFYTERPGVENFGKNSGLGLSISRQIIEAHNGRIWAENRIDKSSGERAGAKFTFEIPAIP